jgi:hypothetical protein
VVGCRATDVSRWQPAMAREATDTRVSSMAGGVGAASIV